MTICNSWLITTIYTNDKQFEYDATLCDSHGTSLRLLLWKYKVRALESRPYIKFDQRCSNALIMRATLEACVQSNNSENYLIARCPYHYIIKVSVFGTWHYWFLSQNDDNLVFLYHQLQQSLLNVEKSRLAQNRTNIRVLVLRYVRIQEFHVPCWYYVVHHMISACCDLNAGQWNPII